MNRQIWKFCNISRGELTQACLFRDLWYWKQSYLVRSLAVPFASPRFEQLVKQNENEPVEVYRKGFHSLPDSVLKKIISDPELSLPETIAFAITCRRMLRVSRKVVDAARVSCSAQWAFNRIACIGNETHYRDLGASGFLNEVDRYMIKQNHYSQAYSGGYRPYGGVDVVCDRMPDDLWRGAFEYRLHLDEDDFIAYFRDQDLAMFEASAAVTFPSDREDWVLCNLTKREYVRASAIAELAGNPNDAQPFLPGCRVDLGHALLARVCWSTPGLGGMRWENNPTNIHRGPWVGDRFSITTMDRLPKGKGGKQGWVDVSKRVVEDLVRIFQEVFGESWEYVLEGAPLPQEGLYWWGSDGSDTLAVVARGALKEDVQGSSIRSLL